MRFAASPSTRTTRPSSESPRGRNSARVSHMRLKPAQEGLSAEDAEDAQRAQGKLCRCIAFAFQWQALLRTRFARQPNLTTGTKLGAICRPPPRPLRILRVPCAKNGRRMLDLCVPDAVAAQHITSRLTLKVLKPPQISTT